MGSLAKLNSTHDRRNFIESNLMRSQTERRDKVRAKERRRNRCVDIESIVDSLLRSVADVFTLIACFVCDDLETTSLFPSHSSKSVAVVQSIISTAWLFTKSF
jgi:hypothetical protein